MWSFVKGRETYRREASVHFKVDNQFEQEFSKIIEGSP